MQHKALRYLLGLISALSTLSGCAFYAPEAPNPNNYVLLMPGYSTLADATHLLGPPSFATKLADGKQLLQWFDYWQWPKLHLAVALDAGGRLIEVRHVYVD